LILCHLLARRAPVLELAGFDESLYPNEENALMDELQKRGGKLIYDPDVVVYRRPRPTLKSFCKMLMAYGRGRAEQFRLHPSLGSAPNFVPPVFVVCLFLIPLWISLGWFGIHCDTEVLRADAAGTVSASRCQFGLAWYPLFAYAFALGVQTMVNCGQGLGLGLCALPLLFATHFFYGLGFWRGVFTRLDCSDRATMEVTLERVTLD
jgi:succinoglycan biosynthesis protein ExoA